ncbi:MAG: FAD:protein FMN transferase [Planctomycetaceae bacterium]|nr:FAD:protein FMN transferase [Planctomycetaceae bacterium]
MRSDRQCWWEWGVSRTGILFACLWFTGTPLFGEELQRFEFLQIRMGIPVNIIVYAPNQPTANEATDAAYARFKELDRIMSDYDPDSELMRLCKQAQPGQPAQVSPDLMTVLKYSQSLWNQSDGAFDVTVGPLVKLWRIARRRKELPEPDRLQSALTRVGFEHVRLCPQEQTVTFGLKSMQLDLGGIAKGYAADEAIAVLKKQGITRALVEAGGDITVSEPPPNQTGWRIELENFQSEEDSKPLILTLKNSAVATSGDAYQYLEIDGVRYSHLLDPLTGLGLTTPSRVTVIASSGTLADGLASAVSVLGPEKGKKLAQQEGADVFILSLGKEGSLESHFSPGFQSHVVKE